MSGNEMLKTLLLTWNIIREKATTKESIMIWFSFASKSGNNSERSRSALPMLHKAQQTVEWKSRSKGSNFRQFQVFSNVIVIVCWRNVGSMGGLGELIEGKGWVEKKPINQTIIEGIKHFQTLFTSFHPLLLMFLIFLLESWNMQQILFSFLFKWNFTPHVFVSLANNDLSRMFD